MQHVRLNPPQEKAVRTTNGRILVLAGAGSGKTRVLTLRIAHLINDKNVDPASILGLTFTNKAAKEMKERLKKTIGKEKADLVTLSTFHSFCLLVLRSEIHRLGYTERFSLYSEREIRRLIENLIRQRLKTSQEIPSLEEVISKLCHFKAYESDAEDIEYPHPQWDPKWTASLVEEIKQSMRAYNAVDFDSLLTLTKDLFTKHPDLLEKYQERFRFIMIDEYQDTNRIQYELTSLLARKHNNLFVVGDDDQSIYGWRGAEIKHILQFESDLVIKLEENYRSTSAILKCANAVIRNNKERHEKELFTKENGGELVRLFHAPTEKEEAEAVVCRMLQLRKRYGVAWEEMAILYRSNILSREIESALMNMVWQDGAEYRRGIPYTISGGTDFYDRSEIKDFLSYLRLIANRSDQAALLRIINVPRRGISTETIDKLTQHQRKHKLSLWDLLEQVAQNPTSFSELLSAKAAIGIKGFVDLILSAEKACEEKLLGDFADWLIETVDMKLAISQEVKSEEMRLLKLDNVKMCAKSMGAYAENCEEASLSHFLSSSLLDKDAFEGGKKKESTHSVQVMTFHSAKGLEFDACFVMGLEDHILPHEKSIKESGVEEERRLLYVAMTRAKKYLTLSMAKTRKKYGKEVPSNPSRFLYELPKEYIKITNWNSSDW